MINRRSTMRTFCKYMNTQNGLVFFRAVRFGDQCAPLYRPTLVPQLANECDTYFTFMHMDTVKMLVFYSIVHDFHKCKFFFLSRTLELQIRKSYLQADTTNVKDRKWSLAHNLFATVASHICQPRLISVRSVNEAIGGAERNLFPQHIQISNLPNFLMHFRCFLY